MFSFDTIKHETVKTVSPCVHERKNPAPRCSGDIYEDDMLNKVHCHRRKCSSFREKFFRHCLRNRPTLCAGIAKMTDTMPCADCIICMRFNFDDDNGGPIWFRVFTVLQNLQLSTVKTAMLVKILNAGFFAFQSSSLCYFNLI